MEPYIVKVIAVDKVTHDTLKISTEKPEGYSYISGQATELAINNATWDNEKRPFTFTSLPDDNHLEFIVKTYPPHNGVTNELLKLIPNDELIIHDSWGAITYKGPGLFIAGGAGVTPFVSIFRQLAKENMLSGNRLIFANKKKEDIILEKELKNYLGAEMINILSDESLTGYRHGFITQQILREMLPHYNENLYVCGPPPMVDAVMQSLTNLGVSDKSVTVEL
ncbi:MAG: flavodoxin reductase [Chitinophagales bacterium]|nr:flavodoxin reductase [Chitinophagales bacterium]